MLIFLFFKNDLTQAFKYLKHHLPQVKQPNIFTYVAPFQHQALTIGNNKLGVGLDMHLGSDYPFYDSAGHPKYISQTFTKQHLLVNSLNGLRQGFVT